MKKLILSLAAICCFLPGFAQASANYFPDEILGIYYARHQDDEYKTCVTKDENDRFSVQVIWRKNSIDPKTGKKILDVKNPDKSLRNVPCDRIVIITGLRYNEEKKCWDKGKIYDPTRGIKVSCKAFFEPDGRLCVKATVAGIGEKIFWKKVDE